MATGEHYLLLCEGFPPVRGIGGRRWAKFAKELGRRGHTVHVIRRKWPAGREQSLWKADAEAPGIVHHPIALHYPEVLTRRPLNGPLEKLQYHFWLRLLPLLVKGNYYDASVFSRKRTLAMAARLIRGHGIRHVIATGAPFRQLAFAAELKQRYPQLNVVADLRDEWTWAGHYGLASLAARRAAHEQRLEEHVVKTVDHVISPHARVIGHLSGKYGGAASRFHVLPNAVDPDDFDRSAPPPADGEFRMIYAGSLYGAEQAEAYFGQVLTALEALRAKDAARSANCRLDLYITGHSTAALTAMVAARGLDDVVHFHGPVPPRELSRRIAGSDLVLIFIPAENKDILGTKFHEIFFLGRPILHVGEPGQVSRTLQERGLGASVRLEALVDELPRFITGERTIIPPATTDHSAYLLANVTDRLLGEVLA